ncbi:MAG TPA: FtsX-like permease family protein [Thermoanaerobaculia bacterium]|nr:FtsX-like permease family protein [Thermoanaerobaculia bacterium]
MRIALTVLSILVAFILFSYLAAIRKAFEMGIDLAGADRLIVRHKVSIIQLLPLSYESDIEAIPGVAEAMHQTWFGGIYQEPKNFFAQIPVVPDELFTVYPEFILPDDQKEAWKRTRTGAIVGRKTAEKFGFEIGDRIPIQATIWPAKSGPMWEFDVVGIYDGAEKGTDTTQLLFRYDFFDENRQYGEGQVGWYVIKVADPDRADAIAQQVDALFTNSPAETKTETEGAFIKAWADQVGNIGRIVTAILTAVFFTILLVAGNTMAQAVRERTRDLGVMKAVGFPKTLVVALVLGESLLLALVGGGIGLALGAFLVSLGDPTGGALPIFFFPPEDLVIGVVLVIFLGLVSGLLPALQAMRLDTVEALRRE